MVVSTILLTVCLPHTKEGTMQKTITAILTGYFNSGEGKRDNTRWIGELRALSPDEKRSLAEGVCALTGDTIKAS
jgi:pyridoxal/pyridoxine/pyridoxamine kinase